MFKHLLIPLLLLTSLLAACGGESAYSQPQDVIVRVAQTGVYTLTAKDLQPYGWDLSRMNGENIQLRQGQTIIPLSKPAKKGSPLQFYAQIEPTRYDNQVAYMLHYGDAAPLWIATREVAHPTTTPARTFTETVTLETNSVYQAQVREGDPWLGQRLFAPAEETLIVQTPHPTADAARLTVTVWAATEAKGDIDHHLTFTLNGQSLGEKSWDGNGPHAIELPIPAGVLAESNELIIASPGDTGAVADLVYLDKVRVSYRRRLQFDSGQLLFDIAAQAAAIENPAGDSLRLWDVTDPLKPVELSVDASSRAQTIAFQEETASPRAYIIFDDAPRKPATLELAPPPLQAPEQGADYIVIAHPDLADAIQPLLAWREAQGLRTTLATTEQIYLEFSEGMQSPGAITDFLRWALETWPKPAPRFVLLVGDASYDPLDYLKAPNKNLVPTAFVSTVVMGETASDNALADVDGDDLPDLTIGRFPAQTPAEIAAMVAKTIDYEKERPAGDWVRKWLFAADDDDPFFSDFNDEIIGMLPAGFEAEKLVIAPNKDVHDGLLAALNDGRGLVSYMGHGAVDIWAKEEIFTTEDVAGLTQEGRLPIILVWACLNGYFQHPKRTSLGETLLLTPEKGAVAGLFPTGETFPNDQLIMARALLDANLTTTSTLGEALLKAIRQLDPENPGQRDIIHTFALLGDPALKPSWR